MEKPGDLQDSCNYPCTYPGQFQLKPCNKPLYDKSKLPPPPPCGERLLDKSQEPKTYQSSYNKTENCICCDKSKNEQNVEKPQPLPPSEPFKIPDNEPGPYVPGQIFNTPPDSHMVTEPYGSGYYCPCPNKRVQFEENCESLEKSKNLQVFEPFSNLPVDEEKEGVKPCYMPRISDQISKPEEKMGPIGPWATGRVDWGPLAGLTGTRPVVDKYTITRYSEGEWRERSGKAVTAADEEIHHANLTDFNGKQCIEQTRVACDKNQQDSTERLQHRAHEILRWKCELERAIAAITDEIELLESERARLKTAGAVLTIPEMIVGECLERRTSRLDEELVRDDVEEQLMREYALIAEIRELFKRTLADLNSQMVENRTAKQRLEFDWSDKKVSCEIDSLCASLNNRSNIIMFRPGAARFQEDQSTPEHWEHFTRETLAEVEQTRQKSVAVRANLDAILVNSARDLRSQADRVEAALTKKINCTDELRDVLETKLKGILKSIADMEKLSEELTALIRKFDTAMKVAQTRLDFRMGRMRVESCRDPAQYGLIDEVKSISEQVTAIKAQLTQTMDSLQSLMTKRTDTELTIMKLRKTLEIDRGRITKLRSFYPSINALMGRA